MLEAVIFDMDGVILDSEPFFIEAENQLLKKHGHDVPLDYQFQFQGTTHDFMWQVMKDEFDLQDSVDNLVNEANHIREALMEEKGVKSIPNVLKLISYLHEQEIPIAIASSSPKSDIEKTVTTFGLEGKFSFLISGEEVAHSKPEPDVFIAAAKGLNVTPENCVVIEDSRNGVLAGKAANMNVIGYRNPNFPPQDLSAADTITSDFSTLTLDDFKNLASR